MSQSAEMPIPNIHGPTCGTMLVGKVLSYDRQELAFYDDDTGLIPYGDVHTGAMQTQPITSPDLTAATEIIEGPTLFGGVVTDRFGHLHLNSLGRLWALDQLPPETTLLYTTRRPSHPEKFPHLQPMLDLLGIKNKVMIRRSPTRFECLYTAADLYGARYIGHGHPAYFNWLDSRMPPVGPVDMKRRVYVTRSRLGPTFGRYANEDHLEELLVAEGYEIFAPEEHSLADQFELYQTAGQLIFAESSSLHIFAMVRRPEQKVAVIQRRDPLPPLIENQLVARPGSEPIKINAIRRVFWPPVRRKNTSVALLDFSTIKKELVQAGFIHMDAIWPLPDEDAETTSVNAGLAPGESMLDEAGRKKFLKEFREKKRQRMLAKKKRMLAKQNAAR